MWSTVSFAVLLSLLITFPIELCSADHDSLHDTCPAISAKEKPAIFINGLPCKNPLAVTALDFKSSELTRPGIADELSRSAVKLVTASEFPGLNTLGLSVARTDLEVDGMVTPHSHPRASELFFVEKGTVVVGFISSGNVIFEKKIGAGDVTVFPRGLLHFCFNAGFGAATAYSVLNSQNPGVVSIGGAMFSRSSRAGESVNSLAKSLVSFAGGGVTENVTLAEFSSGHGF